MCIDIYTYIHFVFGTTPTHAMNKPAMAEATPSSTRKFDNTDITKVLDQYSPDKHPGKDLSKLLHHAYSRAYRRAEKLAIKQNMGETKAKQLGRSKGRELSAEFKRLYM